MVNANQIRQVLADYFSSGNAEKFMLDFSALSYNIHKDGEPEAVALATKVIGKIADLHAGCISLAAFQTSLRGLHLADMTNIYMTSAPTSGSTNSLALQTSLGLRWAVDWLSPSQIRFGDRQSASV